MGVDGPGPDNKEAEAGFGEPQPTVPETLSSHSPERAIEGPVDVSAPDQAAAAAEAREVINAKGPKFEYPDPESAATPENAPPAPAFMDGYPVAVVRNETGEVEYDWKTESTDENGNVVVVSADGKLEKKMPARVLAAMQPRFIPNQRVTYRGQPHDDLRLGLQNPNGSVILVSPSAPERGFTLPAAELYRRIQEITIDPNPPARPKKPSIFDRLRAR